jgi:hypothetical protein
MDRRTLVAIPPRRQLRWGRLPRAIVGPASVPRNTSTMQGDGPVSESGRFLHAAPSDRRLSPRPIERCSRLALLEEAAALRNRGVSNAQSGAFHRRTSGFRRARRLRTTRPSVRRRVQLKRHSAGLLPGRAPCSAGLAPPEVAQPDEAKPQQHQAARLRNGIARIALGQARIGLARQLGGRPLHPDRESVPELVG